ncbi:hypothetical protein [Silvanigrella sp.]|uniref:hypothetical protein n=1 Tax=Silvanigrella sp. TaxID=2024976 RepID=UPI0037CA8E94
MRKILPALILLLLNLFVISSCGKSSNSNSFTQDTQNFFYSKNSSSNTQEHMLQSTNYYIVSHVTPLNSASTYFPSDVNEISDNHQSYFLVKINELNNSKVAISCQNIICKFNNNSYPYEEVKGLSKLLIKLNFPDKITGLSDENGYKYTATKIADSNEIKKINKIFMNYKS